MRRLLIATPAFPPHPSPATHRPRFLVRYAADHGWEAEVLTVDARYYEGALDHDLASLVPPSLRVTRVGALPARWTRPLGVGDLGIRAYPTMRRALRRICGDRQPDLLFLPGWPFFCFPLGYVALREFGVPYVLDYTDPWIPPGPPMPLLSKAGLSNRLALAVEPRAVRHAARILAVSDATHDGVRARNPRIPQERFRAVPFGVELSDFEALRAAGQGTTLWDAADGRVHVAYLGAVSHRMVPTARAIIEAVAVLVARSPELRDRLRLHFVGTSYDPFAERGPIAPLAAAAGLADVVDERPRRVLYGESLRAMLAADVLLAIGSADAHYTPSKIYNLAAAGRPVLAVMHAQSTAVPAAADLGIGELVTFSDANTPTGRVDEIAAALARLIAAHPQPTRSVDPASLGQYRASETSAEIYAMFDEVVAGQRSPVRDAARQRLATRSAGG